MGQVPVGRVLGVMTQKTKLGGTKGGTSMDFAVLLALAALVVAIAQLIVMLRK